MFESVGMVRMRMRCVFVECCGIQVKKMDWDRDWDRDEVRGMCGNKRVFGLGAHEMKGWLVVMVVMTKYLLRNYFVAGD